MDEFILRLPKIELHAHLNGSLKIASIQELCTQLFGVNSQEFLRLCDQFIEFDGLSLNECFKKFKFMHDFTATQRGLQLATMLVIRDFAEDHVVHLELRTTPKCNDVMTKEDYLVCVLQAIQDAKQMYDSIDVKLMPSIDRAQPPTDAVQTVQLALKLRAQFPDLITGIDFSGNPAHGQFSDFVPVLMMARQAGLRLALHCAEIHNPREVAEMMAFGMDRCGHGTFLSDEQVQMAASRNIAVECCLTSNVKCGTVSTFADHHFKRLLGLSNAVVLSTDDCGVFDTTLSEEFKIAAKTFDLKYKDIYLLSMNAVEHAFAREDEKEILRKEIKLYFDVCGIF